MGKNWPCGHSQPSCSVADMCGSMAIYCVHYLWHPLLDAYHDGGWNTDPTVWFGPPSIHLHGCMIVLSLSGAHPFTSEPAQTMRPFLFESSRIAALKYCIIMQRGDRDRTVEISIIFPKIFLGRLVKSIRSFPLDDQYRRKITMSRTTQIFAHHNHSRSSSVMIPFNKDICTL